MWQRILVAGAVMGQLLVGATALAQDEALGPPDALQYPVQASETAARAVTAPFLRKAIEDAADLGLCEALMREAGHSFPGGFRPQDCTPAFAAKVRAGDGIVHWRSENARPLKCGTACFGRPFASATRHVDKPNLRETMLYGRLQFKIDPPGPVDRDLTYGYEVHVQCKAENGARTGNIEVKVEVGDPVLGDPHPLESALDFLLLPVQISRRIESTIRGYLRTIPTAVIGGEACRSIGVSLAQDPKFDAMPFDLAQATAGGVRPGLDAVGGVLTDRARVEFLSITRHPLPLGVAAAHAQPGAVEAGYFNVFLNGANVAFPPPVGAPEGLRLPPEGGSVALNYCRTVALGGADRLQLLFVNALGGAVWSQFARGAAFGASAPRRITTGRTIVVPGTPKPRVVPLREFELLYRIVYLPAPAVSAASTGTRDGERPRPPRGTRGLPAELADASLESASSATPCREI
ncbi:hypothetical protein [Pseudoxanthomonas wuyuanensis]|uniref:Uncharacterized protein n=1 Tax=Pseudoxanthomonas wuyuanensis TaxID=1073196 RepID=A0A286CWN1_9GAMM|nr:hypothetical protein [Pseudoxanthomonas wuyuanensis]KAF1720910.1 hypothetical protein CSC75_09485 [Pseudoxanthomonas wuyuanensis]SOD50820.1 hypothetical protein SAMN06296416_101324 [Pseudoxanthomonas wuyuanensis]